MLPYEIPLMIPMTGKGKEEHEEKDRKKRWNFDKELIFIGSLVILKGVELYLSTMNNRSIDVNVNMPETKPTDINVNMPETKPTDINVNVPEIKVNVEGTVGNTGSYQPPPPPPPPNATISEETNINPSSFKKTDYKPDNEAKSGMSAVIAEMMARQKGEGLFHMSPHEIPLMIPMTGRGKDGDKEKDERKGFNFSNALIKSLGRGVIIYAILTLIGISYEKGVSDGQHTVVNPKQFWVQQDEKLYGPKIKDITDDIGQQGEGIKKYLKPKYIAPALMTALYAYGQYDTYRDQQYADRVFDENFKHYFS